MSKKDWKQFFISVVGTAIGVGLTFFVSGVQQRHERERAQRLTAIMVIHDIDNTIDILKQLKEAEERSDSLLQSVLKRVDMLDTVPFDTLRQVLSDLTENNDEFRFDLSKETIFNSDLDTWQNLGSMKFIDNVQSFFFNRQNLQETLNKDETFVGPIPRDEYLGIVQQAGWVTQDVYAKLLSPFLKKKLSDKAVIYYINTSSYRIKLLNYYIDQWTQQNHENKFLMGLTDKELEDYINSISNNGIAVSPSLLAGRWEYALQDENTYVYDFHSDKSYFCEYHYSSLVHQEFWSGRLRYTASFTGNWSMKADSLIMSLDFTTLDMQMDISGLTAVENKQDSLENWARRYREDAIKYNTERPETEERIAYKARLDSSHDKME